MKGILGRKDGMTEVFTKEGKLIPVTVVRVEPNVVTQVKTVESDGYNAIQVGIVDKKEKRSNKAEIGHAKKANTNPKRFLKEIKGVDTVYELGSVIGADIFTAGEYVDVTGTSKGKGFEGNIKRHNQHRGPMTHGSRYHRGPGSMGTMRPARVLKGKKLPGHMGAETTTIQNLEIIEVNVTDNYILVSGNIPGAKDGLVFIKSAVKKDGSADAKELISYVAEPETVVDEVVEDVVTEEVAVDETPAETVSEGTPEGEEPAASEATAEVEAEEEVKEEEATEEVVESEETPKEEGSAE